MIDCLNLKLSSDRTICAVIFYIDESVSYLYPLPAYTYSPRCQALWRVDQAGRAHLTDLLVRFMGDIVSNDRIYAPSQNQSFNGENRILTHLHRCEAIKSLL